MPFLNYFLVILAAMSRSAQIPLYLFIYYIYYIRKVLRPATSTQVFLGFPVSTSECSDGSQVSKSLLHASHVALQT